MIDRLARFATTEEEGIPEDVPLFEIFSKQIQAVYDVISLASFSLIPSAS